MTNNNILPSTNQEKYVHRQYPLIATSMGHFMNDGMFFLVPVIVDIIAATHHINVTLTTISLVLYYVSTAISANLFGRSIDRRRLQAWGMIVGIVVLSVGMLLFSFAMDKTMAPLFLILSSIVSGGGSSFYHPTGTAILQSYYKGGKLGRYLGINGSAGSLGRAIYPSLLLAVSLVISNSLSAVFFGILGLAVSVVMFAFMREYIAVEKTAKESEGSNDKVKTLDVKSKVSRGIIILAFISLLRNVAFFSIVSWIPEYLTFSRAYGTSLSLGVTMTLMFSGGIAGQLVFGLLVEKHEKRIILMITTVFSVVLMFLYLSSGGLFSLISLSLFGFFNFSGFPIFMSMISDYVPRGSTTVSNAIVWNLGGTTGQVVGPLIVGLIIAGEYSHLSIAFEIMLALGLLSVIIIYALPKPNKESRAQLFA